MRSPTEDDEEKRVLLTLSVRIIKALDELSLRDYATRSAIMRRAILEYLRKPENAAFFKSAETGEDEALQEVLKEFKQKHPDTNL